MSQSEYVGIDVGHIKRETDAALLCVLGDGSETWIPKSQIADPDDYAVGDRNVSMSITEWIANEKGIEGDE